MSIGESPFCALYHEFIFQKIQLKMEEAKREIISFDEQANIKVQWTQFIFFNSEGKILEMHKSFIHQRNSIRLWQKDIFWGSLIVHDLLRMSKVRRKLWEKYVKQKNDLVCDLLSFVKDYNKRKDHKSMKEPFASLIMTNEEDTHLISFQNDANSNVRCHVHLIETTTIIDKWGYLLPLSNIIDAKGKCYMSNASNWNEIMDFVLNKGQRSPWPLNELQYLGLTMHLMVATSDDKLMPNYTLNREHSFVTILKDLNKIYFKNLIEIWFSKTSFTLSNIVKSTLILIFVKSFKKRETMFFHSNSSNIVHFYIMIWFFNNNGTQFINWKE